MAEVKNSFISSKMNKDLDDRLIPNGEYRNAINISINKSTGENVGTAQTVLGNKFIVGIDSATGNTDLEFIGVLPDEANNIIYAFLTNNIIEPYVANGSVGNNQTYPNNQNTSVGGPIEISNAGSGYASNISGTTTNITVTNPNATGLTVGITVDGTGAVTTATIINFGSGYTVGDVVQIDGGGANATITINSILPSDSVIVSYNISSGVTKILAQGSFLNFSTLYPITGLNLLEDLLFFTDNRNQPRKINITRDSSYYTSEDQISVAKYYPYETIQLYQPSETVIPFAQAELSSAVNNTNILPLTTTSGISPSNGDGVIGTSVAIAQGGSNYNTGIASTTGGFGSGLTINVNTVVAGAITDVTIVNTGSGYINGETITVIQAGSDSNAELTVNVVNDNVFVTSENWPTDVTVNQNLTLPSGMELSFVKPETTMQDAISEYLPSQANSNIDFTTTATDFALTLADYTGDVDVIGLNIFLDDGAGNFIDTGSTVTAYNKYVPLGRVQIIHSPGITSPYYVAGNPVKLAISNPYFNSVFKDNANVDFLEDKFVRFSYRFRFDDGEYSLIAPFTQPCFIPKQDGYFTSIEFGTDEELSDEEKAYRSTEVSFMENKVNKILLNIPLPSSANNLNKDLKVTEIDILYKESDAIAIKVVETIPLENNVYGDSPYYQYEYGSKPPFKVLPESDTTRVSDKIPVKALSQEIISNRVVYGNYQDKHTPPRFLDYILGAGAKEETFFISENVVNNYTSIVEYPNAGLKQNRNYEVGVVLSDRFGRQSTVIFSKSNLSGQGSFLSSSIFSQFRTFEDNQSTSSNPINGIPYFDGDSLKIQFNNLISSVKNPVTGTPGLYNGDPNSSDYNPLGWYSFKIVVKQTEQEYYNVYIPTAMAAYPTDSTKELNNTSHIVLYNDNINKIPRDLTEVGPTQREFASSVRLYGRVSNIPDNPPGIITANYQYYTGRAADISTTIGTIKDLFDYKSFPQISTGQYLFYNFEYTVTGVAGEETFPDASSLVARINTNKKFGVEVPTPAGYYSVAPLLNVFEVEPRVSLLDIYYETSTTGRIDLLNKAINEGPPPNVFARLIGGAWLLEEDMPGLNAPSPSEFDIDVTAPFKAVKLDGSDFINPSDNSCSLISVTNQQGGGSNPNDVNEDGIPYYNSTNEALGIFKVVPAADPPNGFFKIVLSLDPASTDPNLVPGLVVSDDPADYTYTFNLELDNPESAAPFVTEITGELGNIAPLTPNIYLPKASPSLLTCAAFPGAGITNINSDIFNVETDSGPLFKLESENGSSTQNLNQLDLQFEISQLTVFNGTTYVPTIIAGKFFIDYNPSDPLFAGTPAVSVPQVNNLEADTTYGMTIKVTDGGGFSTECTVYFEFSLDPRVLWWAPNTSISIVSGINSSPGRYYDTKLASWYLPNTYTCPQPAAPSGGNLGRIQLLSAPVEIRIGFSVGDECGSGAPSGIGLTEVEFRFEENGNFNFPTMILSATASNPIPDNFVTTYYSGWNNSLPVGWGSSTPLNVNNVRVTAQNLPGFDSQYPLLRVFMQVRPA